MKVLNLQCAHQHGFEGWFASEDDFQSQLSRGLVECPMCGDTGIIKMLTAPRLNLGASSPATIFSSVLLPQPLGPSRARLLRGAMASVVGASTCTPAKRFSAPSRAIIGGALLIEPGC